MSTVKNPGIPSRVHPTPRLPSYPTTTATCCITGYRGTWGCGPHITGTQKPRKALPNQEERLIRSPRAWASPLPLSGQTLVLTQTHHSQEGTSEMSQSLF